MNTIEESMIETDQQKANVVSNVSNDDMEQHLQQLKLDNDVLRLKGELQTNLEEKYNKTTSFQAIDVKNQGFIELNDFTEFIKDIPIEGLQNQAQKIFNLMSEEAQDGKVTLQQWSDSWLQQPQRQYEISHKIQMITQKIDIFQALQTPARPGQRLEDTKITSKYQSMVDSIKNSSLTDISQMFSSVQHSPFKRGGKAAYVPIPQSNIIFDLKKDKTRTSEVNFQKYRTPKKDMNDFENIIGRPSFLQKDDISLNIQRSPNVQIQQLPKQRTPLATYQFQIKPEISTKVEKSMNIIVDQKDQGRQVNKTSRRKEDLNSFMSKVGLGKYDAPRVTLDLASKPQSKNVDLDRMKLIVAGKEPILKSEVRKSVSNLNDFFNDPHFASTSFRKQKDTKERGSSQSVSYESASLNDQSLKNYTMKLIHQHKFALNQQPAVGQVKSPQRKNSYQTSYLVRNN